MWYRSGSRRWGAWGRASSTPTGPSSWHTRTGETGTGWETGERDWVLVSDPCYSGTLGGSGTHCVQAPTLTHIPRKVQSDDQHSNIQRAISVVCLPKLWVCFATFLLPNQTTSQLFCRKNTESCMSFLRMLAFFFTDCILRAYQIQKQRRRNISWSTRCDTFQF